MKRTDSLSVLHVTDIIAPRFGGLTTAVLGFCKGLTAQGVKVQLIATDRDYPSGNLPRIGKSEKFENGYLKNIFPTMWAPMGFSPNLARYLNFYGHNFDIIHVHGLYRYAQYAAAKFARSQKIPYIVSPHGALDPYLYNKPERRRVKRIYEHLFELQNLRSASAIHYTADEERKLAEGLGIYTTPGFVTPNGIDTSVYQNLPKRGDFRARWELKENPIILYCGRITKKKGIDLLLPAFACLVRKFPKARLVLAGPDNEGNQLKYAALARQLGVEKVVVFTGMLSQSEVTQAYVDADLLALPSYTENFGMVIVEAMLCGTPVLISNRVNIWREIAEAKAGVVSSCNVDSISESLIELFSNPGYLARLKAKARPTAEKLYSLPIVTRNLILEYNRIIDSYHLHRGSG